MRRLIRLTLGVVCLVLGVIGTLLPIIQGWIFFALALILFFPDHPRIDRLLARVEPRFPRVALWAGKLVRAARRG